MILRAARVALTFKGVTHPTRLAHLLASSPPEATWGGRGSRGWARWIDPEEMPLMDPRIGKTYLARKELFHKGIQQGRLTVQEIERALPPGSLTPAERWLLYYSLRAAQVEILDEVTGEIDAGISLEAEGPVP